jgi:hypothetical protein
LIHYDIHADELADRFRTFLTTELDPPFAMHTESVYQGRRSTVEADLRAFIDRLKEFFVDAPVGTRVFLEAPTHGPAIESHRIVDTGTADHHF